MKTYRIGESIKIYFECKKDGSLYSPATSTTVTVYNPAGTEDLAATNMTESATGKFNYYYQSAGKSAGVWKVKVIATDGTNITHTWVNFKLI